MTKAYVRLNHWKPCVILCGPYDFKNAYRVRLRNGCEMIIERDRIAYARPLTERQKQFAERRQADAKRRADLCAAVLKVIGKEIRLGDLMATQIGNKSMTGINLKLRFWPEFKHLTREWRGRKMWIMNKNFSTTAP